MNEETKEMLGKIKIIFEEYKNSDIEPLKLQESIYELINQSC